MFKGKAKVVLFRALRSGSSSSWKSLLGIMLLLGATLLVVGVSVVSSIPLHASCKVHLKFGLNCSIVNNQITTQIKKWTGDDNCNHGGEKCLYMLKSRSRLEISATHTTPVHKYIDDIRFQFSDVAEDHCKVEAYSRSEVWYAFLDFGTNYCNLHNLITGSKLDKAPGYTENTSNKECTQYTSANCDKY